MINKMSEPRSCNNCKHCYIDDLYYEYCCRLSRCYPELDEEGFPVENTKCKKWGKEDDEEADE